MTATGELEGERANNPDPGGAAPSVDGLEPCSRGRGETTLVTQVDALGPQAGDKALLATLTVLSGPNPGTVYKLTGDEVVLGRDEDAGIPIFDERLSRRHARITRTARGIYLEDLDSTNGTFLRGVRVTRAESLQDGDRVQLGATTVLRYALQNEMEQQAADRTYELSVRDHLTGMYNRRHFDERLRADFAYITRHHAEMCVLMVDVDHFKDVNDSYGHQVGDEVLKSLAVVLEDTMRAEDTAARYGGEEFIVIGRGIDLPGGAMFGERIRAAVDEMELATLPDGIGIAVSVGVAHARAGTYPTADAVVAAADGALYQAKSSGRNRVVIAQTEHRMPKRAPRTDRRTRKI